MFRFELTPNNAGIILWGDTAALDELHQFIHFAVDESPLIKIKDGFMLALAYDIRKAREGCRRTEQYLTISRSRKLATGGYYYLQDVW